MKQELSILIPIYNSDCTSQVAALSRQAEAIEGLKYEIIVADDGSDRMDDGRWMMDDGQLSAFPHVRFIRREQNVGRAAIRNFLCNEAQYAWLLFMDGDMTIPSDDFVRRWLDADVEQVGYGGYIIGRGEETNLRYLYERQCEAMHTAEERRKRPFMHFHTCNFLISKPLMQQYPFDERFHHYGYEDVLFGKRLRQAGIRIVHPDNPAGFFDYEDNAHFVSKTEEGLRTLKEFRSDLRGYSQMLTFVDGIHISAVKSVIRLWHRLFSTWERRNLCSEKPSLRLFKLYKLGYFLTLTKLLLLLILSTPIAAQTPFITAITERGYDENVQDLSDSMTIKIDEPTLAFVNLTGFSKLPTKKTDVQKGYLEMYDGNGHYFRKPVTLNGQGDYTMRYPKKNFSCHFTDATWNEDGAPDLKFGDWVKQDGFHLKAFYTDYARGLGEAAYKLFSQMIADRPPYWERGGYYESSEARCFPDGFPCIVYVKGDFYGIYAWQLKKHRKNMNQKKKRASHIHLDGNLNDQYLFKGTISWNRFEVRTPKTLYTIQGEVYDGNSPKELIDENSPLYIVDDEPDSIRKAKELSAEVKQHIQELSQYWSVLTDIEAQEASIEQMRQEIEQRFDTDALIDYAVHYYFTRNGDGSLKNWQWFTYDGHRWMVTPYDLDQTFGVGLYGNIEPPYRPVEKLTSGPFYWINKYYADDIADRYITLRENGVFDYDNVVAIIDDWRACIGEAFYTAEEERWPLSPCYSDAVCNSGWETVPLDDPEYYLSGQGSYKATKEYHTGDVCWLEGRLWRATTTITGVKPFITNANKDSEERIHNWVKGRIEFLDTYFAYTPDAIEDIIIAESPKDKRLAGIYTLAGIKISTPLTGKTYIFRYSNGTSRKVHIQ